LVAVKLYVIPGSHPSKAAELMLRHKGIDFKRVDLVVAMHRPVLKAVGFPGKTVPAMTVDGHKVQGTRAISRALDELKPDPPLLPSGAVEEAERWGDEELQSVPRRLAWWGAVRLSSKQRTEVARQSLQGYRVGLPTAVASRSMLPFAKIAGRYNNATDDAVRADLAGLPDKINRVDALIAEGVIGGEEPNAADFQIATSVKLLLSYDDLKDLIEGRPAAEHARRIAPDYELRFPPVFPREWLPSRAAA
jgi:glutathione S-transferase